MNNDFVLIADAACDMTEVQMIKSGIKIIPMEVLVDGNVYKYHPSLNQLDMDEFYINLKKGAKTTTTQINIATYEEFFEPFLKSGKDIIYVSFSSKLSGTYTNSVVACKNLAQKYPERRIESIDSKSASAGFGLLMYLAGQRKSNGGSFDEIKSFVERTRNQICHWFTVDDLNQLKRGGRISSATALLGGMVGIKPVLHVDDDGFLQPVEKVRGRKASINRMFEHMKETVVAPKGQTVFIVQAHCEEDAKYLAKLIKSELHIKDIKINTVGPVSGTHSGYGTLALFFVGSER